MYTRYKICVGYKAFLWCSCLSVTCISSWQHAFLVVSCLSVCVWFPTWPVYTIIDYVLLIFITANKLQIWTCSTFVAHIHIVCIILYKCVLSSDLTNIANLNTQIPTSRESLIESLRTCLILIPCRVPNWMFCRNVIYKFSDAMCYPSCAAMSSFFQSEIQSDF